MERRKVTGHLELGTGLRTGLLPLFALGILFLFGSHSQAQSPVRGDANDDGALDVADLIFLGELILQQDPPPTGRKAALGDVDGDGDIDEDDRDALVEVVSGERDPESLAGFVPFSQVSFWFPETTARDPNERDSQSLAVSFVLLDPTPSRQPDGRDSVAFATSFVLLDSTPPRETDGRDAQVVPVSFLSQSFEIPVPDEENAVLLGTPSFEREL